MDEFSQRWAMQNQAVAQRNCLLDSFSSPLTPEEVRQRMAEDKVELIWNERLLRMDAQNKERLRRWRVKYEMLHREGVML